MKKKIWSGIEKVKATTLAFISEIRIKVVGIQVYAYLSLCLVCLVCFFSSLILYQFVQKERLIKSLSFELEDLQESCIKIADEHKRREAYKQTYALADSNYLAKVIEPLVFLQKEVQFLQTVGTLPALAQFGPIKQRMEYLTQGQNQAVFEETFRKTQNGFQEVGMHLHKPIAVNEHDIERLLSLLEDVPINHCHPSPYRPQIFFKEFSIERIPHPNSGEVYNLDMSVITREIVQ